VQPPQPKQMMSDYGKCQQSARKPFTQ